MISRMDKSVEETVARIAEDLRCSGSGRGDIVLVHSSLSSMGYVPGGPETVVRGLLEALGSEGTLLMPALSFNLARLAAPGFYPLFDYKNTSSVAGKITEHFRTRPGTLRSLHPTHSVCGVGPLAERILGEHQLDCTPCGEHSPYRKLYDVNGKLLFLGCGLKPNTSMHAVEELAEAPYLFDEMATYRVLLPDGREILMHSRKHGFISRGLVQRYDRLALLLEGSAALKTGRVLQATLHIVEAVPMWDKAVAMIKQDPYFFVDKE